VKLDGSTSGRRVYVDGTCDGKVIKRLWFYPDGCKHCPHATRLRLQRLPRWLDGELWQSRDDYKHDLKNARHERREVDRLTKAGHTSHCAARLVWGDGACECGCKSRWRRNRLPKRGQQSVNIHAARESMCGGYLKQWF
jgi:hypothetical protein